MTPAIAAQVIAEARSWIGTPYHHKGRVKGVGVDCGGMVYACYEPHYHLKPFPDDYPADWCLHDQQELYLDWISPYVSEVRHPVPGGLSLFRFGKCYAHAAIYTEKNTFIHAYGRTKFGQVKEDPLTFFRVGGLIRPVRHFDTRD